MTRELRKEKATGIILEMIDLISITLSHFKFFWTSETILDPSIGTIYRRRFVESPYTIKEVMDCIESLQRCKENEPYVIKYNEVVFQTTGPLEFITCDMTQLRLGNRTFELYFYNDPDDVGFNSIYPDFDYERYVAVYIRELREDLSEKYSIIFGFDLVTMTLVEIFDISFQNKIGICKEPSYSTISELEKELFGKKITIFELPKK